MIVFVWLSREPAVQKGRRREPGIQNRFVVPAELRIGVVRLWVEHALETMS